MLSGELSTRWHLVVLVFILPVLFVSILFGACETGFLSLAPLDKLAEAVCAAFATGVCAKSK